jgi:hypothetical protein
VRTRLPVTFWKSGAEFTPAEIPGLALWLDASDAATLFQDAAATTPATATSDPVGAWLDKSGNARHAVQATAGNRPTISATLRNNRPVTQFASASNQTLSADSLSSVVTGSDVPMTAIAVCLASSSASTATILGFGNSSTDTPFFVLEKTVNDGIGTRRRDDASSLAQASVSGASLTSWSIASMTFAGQSTTLSLNGADVANNAALDCGTLSLTTANIGALRRTSVVTPFASNIAELLVYSRAVSPSERRRLEVYLANRWGITLAPQVSNLDAQDWINRVYANGGTVSASTAAAVNTLCNSLDAASLRDRFYRLNLFCGTGLNAALVPLYRGPSLGGTQYGNATDTNVGPFVSGDYAETGASGGLNSGASNSSKYLRTGIAPSDMSAVCTNVHASVYSRAVMSSNSQAIGANAFSFFPAYGGTRVFFRTNGNNSGLEGTITTTSGHILAVRTGAAAADLYRNGSSQGGTPADNGTTASETSKLLVFGTGGSETASVFFPGTLQMYSLGLGMTTPQAAAFYSAVQSFQTSLTRNL